MLWIESHAQVALNGSQTASANKIGTFSKTRIGTAVAVNLKTERDFKKNYPRTSEAEWSVLSDKSLMCRFFMNNILYRAYYTAHGRWLYTFFSYDASKLKKEVYDKIKSVYYNFNIVFVNQIDLINGKTTYIVEIQDEKSIKKLRVDDDEMEIVQELERCNY